MYQKTHVPTDAMPRRLAFKINTQYSVKYNKEATGGFSYLKNFQEKILQQRLTRVDSWEVSHAEHFSQASLSLSSDTSDYLIPFQADLTFLTHLKLPFKDNRSFGCARNVRFSQDKVQLMQIKTRMFINAWNWFCFNAILTLVSVACGIRRLVRSPILFIRSKLVS